MFVRFWETEKAPPQTKTSVKNMMYPVMKPSSIEIGNALNISQNFCLFHGVGNNMLKSFCKDSNHCMYMTQLENNLASWLILIDNKIPLPVKILVYFLSRIAFKTYESQYRSKYSVRFTQLCLEGKNF